MFNFKMNYLFFLSQGNDAISADQVKHYQDSIFQLECADQILTGMADELIRSESGGRGGGSGDAIPFHTAVVLEITYRVVHS